MCVADARQLDTSDKLVDWITKEGYNLIDINVLAQLPTQVMKVFERLGLRIPRLILVM